MDAINMCPKKGLGGLGKGYSGRGLLSPWGSGIRMPALEPPHHLLTMAFEVMPA